MSRRQLKRTAGFILWLSVLCLFTGCRKEQDFSVDSEKEQKEVFHAEAVLWEGSSVKPESISALCFYGSKVFFAGNQDGQIWLYKMNMDGKDQEKKKIETTSSNIMVRMETDGQGKYGMIVQEDHFISARQVELRYSYIEYEEKKNKLKQTGIWKIDDPESIMDSDLDTKRIAVMRNSGNIEIYEMTQGKASELEQKYTIDCGNAEHIMLDGENLWVSSGRLLQKWDIAGNEKLLEVELDTSDALRFFVRPGQGEKIYCMSSDGIFQCSGDGRAELLMEWLDNGISGSSIICMDGDGEVFFAPTINKQGMYRIEKGIKKDTGNEKETITVATTDTAYNTVFTMSAIEKFNSSQDKYLAKLTAYGKYENPEEKIRLDVVSGKGPDVILIANETENILDQLDKKGGLEDLYPYMDKEPEVSRDDFVENALRILETDGKLTRIAKNFTVHAMIGRKDFIGDRKSWTWEEFVECCKAVPEDEYPYIDGYDMFRDAFPSIYGQFFDLQAGKVLMGDGSFVKDKGLSEQIYHGKKWDRENFDDTMEERLEKVRKGEFYIGSYSMDSMPFVLAPHFGMPEKEQELALIGYPSDTGTGVSMSFGELYAITSFSEHKEGAWQFLKSILTEGKNMYTCMDGSLPLRKDYYEINKKCMLAEEDYVDEDGVEIHALGSGNGHKVTEQDIEMVEQIIEMADCRTLTSHHPVREIVEEELAAYSLEKERTLEQTAEYIEKRVNIYLSETS